MRDLTRSDRVLQRAGDVLLTDDGGKGLRPIAAIEGRAFGHRSTLERYDPLREDNDIPKERMAVHPPSITDITNTHTRAAQIRLACGTRRRPLTAASFRI